VSNVQSDPNQGNIEIEIKVIAGKDSLVQTMDDHVIGKDRSPSQYL
jgi:hypothetical protein